MYALINRKPPESALSQRGGLVGTSHPMTDDAVAIQLRDVAAKLSQLNTTLVAVAQQLQQVQAQLALKRL
jgi:hypothetical protein